MEFGLNSSTLACTLYPEKRFSRRIWKFINFCQYHLRYISCAHWCIS